MEYLILKVIVIIRGEAALKNLINMSVLPVDHLSIKDSIYFNELN